jgi:superfamily II DNA or RNA helicase
MNLAGFIRDVLDPKKDITRHTLHRPATIDPRTYQVVGANWMMEHERVILADDGGVGKTIQASMAATRPALVVCPTYAMWMWHDWLREQYPDETVAIALGDVVKRTEAINARADWTIINVEMLRKYWMPVERLRCVIFDEFHHVRGADSEQGKNAVLLAKRVPQIIGLTATPIYKDVGDLWHLLHILYPEKWHAQGKFMAMYAKTIDNGYNTRVWGIKNVGALQKELRDVLLRRTYNDVGLELPAVIDKQVVLEFPTNAQKEYNAVKHSRRYEDIPLTSASEVLHTLRRMTVEEKAKAAQNIIRDSHQQAAVMCWYNDTVEYVAHKIGGVPIHGQNTKASERAIVARRAIKAGIPIVAGIESLGESVDLSACKNVVFVEESYVPGAMHQVLRRFQRWSTNISPCVVSYVRVKGTVDVTVHTAHTTRRNTASLVLRDALS